MVDFGKLRQQRATSKPGDPIEIFLRLPKTSDINDLWNSQAEALKEWFKRRGEKDLVTKLNTGGGKTLVGLIIAQSIINEKHGSVLYLSPNNQLVGQIMGKAKEYGIDAVRYVSGQDLDEAFLSGRCIMIATYTALFNGLSRFGVAWGKRDIIRLEGVILDDAHAAFADMRDNFTISVENSGDTKELYSELAHMFRGDFGAVGRQGTFDDIVSSKDRGVLEVPYWSWLVKFEGIRKILSNSSETFAFTWPLVRDCFHACHALVSSRNFSITPLQPMVDMFPTFAECPHRIYMSATLADDSSIVRTFDASPETISQPIAPSSLAGVGERMILAPALMQIPSKDIGDLVKALAKWISKRAGVVILTPSRFAAEKWKDVAQVAQGDEVGACVEALVQRKNNGPYVFPNRYDGIDLPDDSCRLLILDGLPTGANPYDLYRATVFEGSSTINATIAQRVEQGMGRGTRGAGDHCVVLLTGNNLISWISLASNLNLMTPSTRAQLQLGLEVSRNISNPKELKETIEKCLMRDKTWIEYHAEVVADSTMSVEPLPLALKLSELERQFFRLSRDGYYEKAIGKIEKFVTENRDLDSRARGWLLQLAARGACTWEDEPRANLLQQQAYGFNHALLRPKVAPAYVKLVSPTKQSENIVNLLSRYEMKKGIVARFEEVAELLVPQSSSNQFEESMKSLGMMLGFHAQRPEHEFGKGPDILWVIGDKLALVMEAKSRKSVKNALTKDEHGQLLVSFDWFQNEYPTYRGYKVVVHPNALVTDAITAKDCYALTIHNLSLLITSTRELLIELSSIPMSQATLHSKCEKLLKELSLTPSLLIEKFFEPFH